MLDAPGNGLAPAQERENDVAKSPPAARNGAAIMRRFADPESMIVALEPSNPIYCLRPHVLAETAGRFLDGFAGRVLYAVKCNPHPAVLQGLFDAGIRHFDTASLTEIAAVCEAHPEAEAYFMHPVKSRAALLSAHRVYDMRHYVIDHADELEKILQVTGGGDFNVLVRVATPPGKAVFELSAKFGAEEYQAVKLLRDVHEAGLGTGLAFHVGSQCVDPEAFTRALGIVGRVMEDAGVPVKFIDVGGGFPANYANHDAPPLDDYFAAIREGLAALPPDPGRIAMCEPGRALVAGACSLVVQVQLCKGKTLYINDGIMHSLSELAAGIRLPARLIRPAGDFAKVLQEYTVFGPTCDSADVLPDTIALPADVREGDWIEFGQIGAYSNAMATHFNGFHPDTFVTVDSPAFLPD